MKRLTVFALLATALSSAPAFADGYPGGNPLLKDLYSPKPAAADSSNGIQRKTWLPYREGPVDEVQPQDVMPLVKSGADAGATASADGKVAPKCDGKTGAGWEAKEGKRLQQVLDSWAACSGWNIRWMTDQQYPLRASANFDGDFVQAASNLVGAFAQANPPAFAQFFPDNKTVVITTPTELDGE